MITLQNLGAAQPAPHAANALPSADQEAAGTAPAQFAAVLAGQRALAAGAAASAPVAASKHAPPAGAVAKMAEQADSGSALPGEFAALVAGQRDVAKQDKIASEETQTEFDASDAAISGAPQAPNAPDAPVPAAAPDAIDAPATRGDAGNAGAPAVAAAIPLLAPGQALTGGDTTAREAKPPLPAAALRTEPPASGKPGERGRTQAAAQAAAQAAEPAVRDSLRALGGDTPVMETRVSRPAGETEALAEYFRAGEQREPAPIVTAGAQPQSQVREAVRHAPHSPQLDAPIGSARWGEQLSNQVIVLAQSATPSADIRVTPPELGPVHVRISVEDGVASIVLSAPVQETRQALEAALPALHDALAESGISLGESAVSDEHLARQEETRIERERRESNGAEPAPVRDPAPRPQRSALLDMYA